MSHLFDNILQNFQASKRNVDRYLSVGMIFTLLCFFYIVEPYFTYTSYQQKAQKDRVEMQDKLQKVKVQLERMKEVNKNAEIALQSIQLRINKLPDHLHDEALPKIKEALESGSSSQPQQQQLQQVQSNLQPNAALFPPDITDFNKAVNWYIQNWFRDLTADLKAKVVEPISEVNQAETANQTTKLDSLTQAGIIQVNKHLKTIDPEFWYNYSGPGGKVSTANSLKEVVSRSFAPVQMRLDSLLKNTSHNMSETKALIQSRQNISQEIERNIQSLDDRITSMSSPFGPIPLRTTELIILFPVLLAILMMLTVSALRKSSQLYDELWEQYETDKKEGRMQQFQLYTDCWYLPPYPNFVQPLLLAMFTAIVIGIYIYSSLLIYSAPGLFTFPGSGAETARYSFFIGTYVLGLIVLAGCVWFGYKSLYSSNFPFYYGWNK